jgi:SAM-dependent methyltransferase
MPPASSNQTEASIGKNASFFRDNVTSYSSHVSILDSYRNIRACTNEALRGIDRLLDVGNGGTFDYDVTLVRELVAVDLFLGDLPASHFPPNVLPKNGTALNLLEPDASFDGVIMSMLLHHLVGKSLVESKDNTSRAVAEAFRVLKPGGRLVLMESCVPAWFYRFEKIVFRPACRVIERFLDHPPTIQYTPAMIATLLRSHTPTVEVTAIPKGRWLLQYGFKYPAALTPAKAYLFVAYKH